MARLPGRTRCGLADARGPDAAACAVCAVAASARTFAMIARPPLERDGQRVRRRLNTLRARQVGQFQVDVATCPVVPSSFAAFARDVPSIPESAATCFVCASIRCWPGFDVFMHGLPNAGRLAGFSSGGPTTPLPMRAKAWLRASNPKCNALAIPIIGFPVTARVARMSTPQSLALAWARLPDMDQSQDLRIDLVRTTAARPATPED